MREVLRRLKEAGVTLKLKKCEFARQFVPYLGHTIDLDGVRPNLERVEAVLDIQPPFNIRGLQSFLERVEFFRMFIKDFCQIAKPLTMLTKMDAGHVKENWRPA